MGKDFIRYYISDIHLSMLETVQWESGRFDEWDLSQGSDFTLSKSYGYKADSMPACDKALLKALAKCSVIAETKLPKIVKPSILWANASNIADVLTLLSIARAKTYPTLVIESNLEHSHSINWNLINKEFEGNWDIVPANKIARFISEAFTYIYNNLSWLEESGFIPSIYWLTQAQKSCFTAPSILEMGLYWISLEVLSRAYFVTNKKTVMNKRELVKRFVRDKGYSGDSWDYLDKAIDDWYIARNDLFHEGMEKLPIDLLRKRGNQIRDFAHLVFIEMLLQQSESRREEIATRIKNY